FNAVAWTISCEAFFYAMFPLVRRRGALIVGAVTLAAFIILYRTGLDGITQVYPNFFNFFPLAIFWKFCLGLALAQLWAPRELTLLVGTALETIAVLSIISIVVYAGGLSGDLYAAAFVLASIFTIAV